MSDDQKRVGPIPDNGMSRIGTNYGAHILIIALVLLACGFAAVEFLGR